MDSNGQSQKSKIKKEKERECWQMIFSFRRLLESWIPDLEKPLWQTGVMSLEGETIDTSNNRGEA